MSNESAKEIHATVTGSAQPDEEPTIARTGPVDTTDELTGADHSIRGQHAADDTDESDVIDPDAVIIDETVTPSSQADGPARPVIPESARADVAPEPTPGRADPMADTPPDVTGTAAHTPPAPAVNDTTATAAPGSTGPAGDAVHLHDRWTSIQSTFVDDPHGSVVAAAELVTEAIETLVSAARERERGLRNEWDRDGADTEDLRNALRSYRGFLDHLAAL